MIDAAEKKTFGKQEVIARLGRGGMGDVFLTVHPGPAGVNKIVVVKELHNDLATNPEARAMFLDEARLATRLNHPNLVQTYEVVDDPDSMYLTMEFLDGQPLSRILSRENRSGLSVPALLSLVVGITEGLHYAHGLTDYSGKPLGVVHRDVSPHNIIVTYDGHAKLVDFGVAKVADAVSVTRSGVFKGKVKYAAPEQALSQTIDRRADIFALGTIIWEIIVGERMWKDIGDTAVLFEIAAGKIPRMRDVRPDVPPELDAICAKALAVDPDDRYSTAKEFGDALRGYIAKFPSRPDDREIGETIARTFATERDQLRSQIDSQIKALRESSAWRLRLRSLASSGETASVMPGVSMTPGASTRGGLTLEEAPTLKPPSMARARKVRFLQAGTVALVLVAIVVWVAVQRTGRNTSAASAGATAATNMNQKVHVVLRAQPSSATLLLDGVTLPSNPYEADLARDESAHKVSAQANGFEQRTVDAAFMRDLSIDLTLARAPEAPTTAEPTSPQPRYNRPPAVAPRPAPPATTSKPSRPPSRPIDEESPYSK